jgi:hypothetical protein
MTQQDETHGTPGRLLPAGEYGFADVNVGDHYATSGVTVTEAHIVGFAGLTGDLFDVHMDDQFAREAGLPGELVVHVHVEEIAGKPGESDDVGLCERYSRRGVVVADVHMGEAVLARR